MDKDGGLAAILRILLGLFLVLLGVTGLILPIMPGWVFLIPGLVILSNYFPPLKRLLHWAREKVENTRKPAAKI